MGPPMHISLNQWGHAPSRLANVGVALKSRSAEVGARRSMREAFYKGFTVYILDSRGLNFPA